MADLAPRPPVLLPSTDTPPAAQLSQSNPAEWLFTKNSSCKYRSTTKLSTAEVYTTNTNPACHSRGEPAAAVPLWRSVKLDRRKVTLQRSRSQVFGMPQKVVTRGLWIQSPFVPDSVSKVRGFVQRSVNLSHENSCDAQKPVESTRLIYFEWGGSKFQLKRPVLDSPVLLICDI